MLSKKMVFPGVILSALLLFIAGFFFMPFKNNGTATAGKNARHISPREAKEFLDKHPDAILLDVRTPQENQEARLANSILLPVDKVEEHIARTLPDKNKPVVIYCRTGRRSAFAMSIMEKMGYTNLMNMTGGIIKWHGEGLPVISN